MSFVQSLALNTFVAVATVAIGASTEVRAIVRTRVRLASACNHEGVDERFAFELAGVDRHGIERRLYRAALVGAIALTVAFVPARLLATQLAHQFDWSRDTRLAAGTLLNLVGPVLWSAHQVRRTAPGSATM